MFLWISLTYLNLVTYLFSLLIVDFVNLIDKILTVLHYTRGIKYIQKQVDHEFIHEISNVSICKYWRVYLDRAQGKKYELCLILRIKVNRHLRIASFENEIYNRLNILSPSLPTNVLVSSRLVVTWISLVFLLISLAIKQLLFFFSKIICCIFWQW